MTYDFNTRDFALTYGKAPKGYGSWAFRIEDGEIIWAPTSTFADAKRWVKEQAKLVAPVGYKGEVRVYVCT